MKACKVVILIFICSIVHLNKTFAQSDYVITKKNDTIFCDIKGSFFNANLKYKAKADEKYSKIDTNVIEYFLAVDTSTYVLKTISEPKKHRQFVKWIQKGRINLYDQELTIGVGSSSYSSSFWYASKGNDSLKLIKVFGPFTGAKGSHKERKEDFIELISDFSSLLEGFKTKAYTYENILDCIVVYNSEYLTNKELFTLK